MESMFSATDGGAGATPMRHTSARPVIWALQTEKIGDNAQIDTLLGALDLPVTVKRLRMQQHWQVDKPPIEPGIGHLDQLASDPLEPPWPDLVVLSGRRSMNVALWLRQQSHGHTRLVLVGRPHGLYESFDLIVAAPQYRLAQRPNVINLALPLIEPPRAAVSAAVEAWREEFATLPGPLTAVLVGGPALPFRFDAAVAQQLVARVQATVGGTGTLYFCTSRRTPAEVSCALARALSQNGRLYQWTPESARNPYLGLLGLADRFVVTGDSVSMLVEVARLGHPLAIFGLPFGHGPRQLATRLLACFGTLGQARRNARPQRDITRVHRALYRQGLAVPLGKPFPLGRPAAGAGVDAELAAISARVRALLGFPATQAGSVVPVHRHAPL